MDVLKRAQEPEGARFIYSSPVPSRFAKGMLMQIGDICTKTRQSIPA